MSRYLCVRLDSAGDVLLAGPAVRAVAAEVSSVTLLAGPLGAEAARLLPGIDEVIVWSCPWIAADPEPTDYGDVQRLIARVGSGRFDAALIFTSFHQSPLPTALLLRLAGIRWVGAISEDYPGSLLDLRHRLTDHIPEAERALSLVRAAGFELPYGDDGRLRIREPLPDTDHLTGPRPYIVLHPGTSAPARAWPVERFAQTAELLAAQGYGVVLTGSSAEKALTAAAAGNVATDLGGRTDLAQLAAVIADADAIVVGNTGPAHLAAAVGTPVVSLFAPTIPAVRWAPYGVPHALLGNQNAPCRSTRATACPIPGHPCLASVTAEHVQRALQGLIGLGDAGPTRTHKEVA